MRATLIAFVILLFIARANAQVYKYVEKIPSFSVSVGTTFLTNSKDFGGFYKFYLPTNNGFAFFGEAVALFPSNSNYKEYRLEYGFEVVFLKIGGLSTHACTGFNYGYWQRKDEYSLYYQRTVAKPAGNHYHEDDSHFFGGGIDYEFNKNVSIYSTYKVYPLIYTTYIEGGIRFNVYELKRSKVKRRRTAKTIIK